jgi:hypothetical protein
MNKHEEFRDSINNDLERKFSIGWPMSQKIWTYSIRAEQTEKELELYKQLFAELNMSIELKHWYSEGEIWVVEDIEQSPATEKALQLFKEIQELGGKKE